jgi:hypothetical protein
VVSPNPITRLFAVAEGLRALAAELEDIQGEVPLNLVWWADEIDRSIADLRRASATGSRDSTTAAPDDNR